MFPACSKALKLIYIHTEHCLFIKVRITVVIKLVAVPVMHRALGRSATGKKDGAKVKEIKQSHMKMSQMKSRKYSHKECNLQSRPRGRKALKAAITVSEVAHATCTQVLPNLSCTAACPRQKQPHPVYRLKVKPTIA